MLNSVLWENIHTAFISLRINWLRSLLTASMIAVGIAALVGILTAIDAVEHSVNVGLGSLGANAVTIKDIDRNQRIEGKLQVQKPRITYAEALAFKENFQRASLISISASLGSTSNITAKRFSYKTNPNLKLVGVDEDFFSYKKFKIERGRTFFKTEIQTNRSIAVIGAEVARHLFDELENPVGQKINILGNYYTVIGVLQTTKGLRGGESDRGVFIPITTLYQHYSSEKRIFIGINILLSDRMLTPLALDEIKALFRQIRRDTPFQKDSFLISKSDNLSDKLLEISHILRLGGSIVGIMTLTGASIGLMNILLVSVTERTKEIGIRKALGATPQIIMNQFLIESTVICLIGGLAGILIGIGFGNAVSQIIGNGEFLFPVLWVGIGFMMSILTGVAAGYYPARKAAFLNPIDALRYE
ncbi:MAG: ABC transporter permease [Cytophagales bacterium]|nr:ABC transporter permease [Cytophagales bacterium]MDW8384428.1 ABC transporter permease [Flammeovirgaceae bacterium]